MLVDDNMAILSMGKNMLKDKYKVYPLPSAAKLFEMLSRVIPDLILLDIDMPEMDGYETLRRLKIKTETEGTEDIPVIFLTGRKNEASEMKGLNMGAIDYVYKPFSAPLLLRRIETHLLTISQKKELKNHNENLQAMVRKQTDSIFSLQSAVLSTVSELVEFRDTMTGNHVSRTQRYLQLLIAALIEENIYRNEMAHWNLYFLLPSAQLHDVGKIAIGDAILNKPGKLTPEEFEIMKTHVTIGISIIEKIGQNMPEHDFLKHAKTFVATHHERWDGTGYPVGLSGEDIPLEGRLMAIADVYDALISRRSYKPSFSREKAERIIIEGGGKHFDPVLVEMFRKTADGFAEISNYG
jgi:putative two-component system response regulator